MDGLHAVFVRALEGMGGRLRESHGAIVSWEMKDDVESAPASATCG